MWIQRAMFPAFIMVICSPLSHGNAVAPGNNTPNLSNLAQLTASDGAQGNEFGTFVALSGSTVVVGSGKVYVFVKPATGWVSMTQTAELSASDGALLGAVAIDSNTVVARAPVESRLYVFVKPATGWTNMTETAILSSSDQADILGVSVSVSGNTIVAGSGGSQNGSGPSTTYVFVEPVGGWANMTQTAELTSSDGGGPFFAAAVSGNTVVAGGFGTTVGSNADQGAAYVFVRPSGGWTNMTENARLTASDGAAQDALGLAVAISGSTIVAAAPGATIAGRLSAGASYVFSKPAGGWATMTQTGKLTASDPRFRSELGSSTAISGNAVVAGAPEQPVGNTQDQGSAYTFAKPATGWANRTQTQKLTASDGSGALGTSVAVSASTVAAGAPFQTVGSNKLQGAVYVFAPAQSKAPVRRLRK